MTNFLVLMTEIIGGLADLKTLLDSDNCLKTNHIVIIFLAILLALIAFVVKRDTDQPSTANTTYNINNFNVNIMKDDKK